MSRGQLDSRAAAAQCLAAVAQGASLAQQLPVLETRIPARDRGLYRQLCYGTLRAWPRLSAYLAALLQRPLKDRDGDVQMLLALGIYQLQALRTPDHAAVSATVAAADALHKPWSKKLVNGVLRNWLRRRDALERALTPAQRAAHPDWLHRALHEAWPQQAEAIEQANNSHPPMCLRVNSRRGDRASYLDQLRTAGIEATACDYAAEGVRLLRPVDVEQLPGFGAGEVSVQDEAAQLSAHLLQLQPGQRVLDACCAPGGKTGHLLEQEPALAELVALDIDDQRLQRVRSNLDRLQLRATLVAADAGATASWWDGRAFDRILLDAPCSATGVMRRNPDIKLHRRPDDIDRLRHLQHDLLHALWPTLAPGGVLLYATCSVLPAENEQVVAMFCGQTDDAVHLPIDATWGLQRPYGRQLLPAVDGHDGFYYALLSKRRPAA